jgi:hypothetical protein
LLFLAGGFLAGVGGAGCAGGVEELLEAGGEGGESGGGDAAMEAGASAFSVRPGEVERAVDRVASGVEAGDNSMRRAARFAGLTRPRAAAIPG